MKRQIQGIDIVFKRRGDGAEFLVDEKAQLDYVNEDLPTFAFELQYEKEGIPKKGWLFDTSKKTDFYSLATGIYSDEPKVYTSCKITFVNRAKLISFLNTRHITAQSLHDLVNVSANQQKKLDISNLDPRYEGYLYFSNFNKAERPINLVLKLDFLATIGVAKRLI